MGLVRIKKGRIKVEVFVPLGSCACSFAPFMEKVGRVTSKYKSSIDFQAKSIGSSEASKRGIEEICVVVDEVATLSADFNEKDLEKAIINRMPLS